MERLEIEVQVSLMKGVPVSHGHLGDGDVGGALAHDDEPEGGNPPGYPGT